MTKFLNISKDNTLGGNSPSDLIVSSQKAIKEYIDNNSGNVDIDNNSITTNASDEIQTVGVINQNDTTTAIKTWTGTTAQYNAITTKDSSTLYTITDDEIPSDFADRDLSNLSVTGQAVLNGRADTDLSNLSVTGQAILDNKVDLTETQTITGSKSITGKIILKTKNTTVPNNSLYGEMAQQGNSYFDLIGLYDTTYNCRCATIRAYNKPDQHGILLAAHNFNNGSPNGIDVAFDDSNNLTTKAHTPSSATNNSTEIATTAWKYNNDNTMRTNCITEIPQDIQWTFSNGTFTLKAGSKVYFPNGSGIYDEYIVPSDLTISSLTTSGTSRFLFLTQNDKTLTSWQPANTVSGDTDSKSGTTYHTWYDTANNLIKCYDSSASTINNIFSFPIALVSCNNGTILSIDQVFNGFGYIGSTVFALPGVKIVCPNGRNSNGTLNNTIETVSRVLISTYTGTSTMARIIGCKASDISMYGYLSYDKDRNLNLSSSSGSTSTKAKIGLIQLTSGNITSFTFKQVFHTLDWSDSSTISGWSVPSSKYINLTLGASGTTYTAPANGWYYLNKVAGSDWYYIKLAVSRNNVELYNEYDADYRTTPLTILIPVLKGDVVSIAYNATGATNYFRFFYNEGEI